MFQVSAFKVIFFPPHVISFTPHRCASYHCVLCPQVVICGAVPSMVRSVRLYNDCSSSDVRVDMKGRVLADDDKSDRFREYLVERPALGPGGGGGLRQVRYVTAVNSASDTALLNNVRRNVNRSLSYMRRHGGTVPEHSPREADVTLHTESEGSLPCHESVLLVPVLGHVIQSASSHPV
jgi:hypothetical protein